MNSLRRWLRTLWCYVKPGFHSNAITASTEHSYWLALAFVAWKFQHRQPIGMLGRSSGNHDWLLANASACVSCGFRLRNASDCVWMETGLKCSLKNVLTSLYLVEGLAWWDLPFIWCSDQCCAWHCWLGHLTRKNRPRYDPQCVWWDVKPYSTTTRHCIYWLCIEPL